MPKSRNCFIYNNLIDYAILLSYPSFYEDNIKKCTNLLMDNGFFVDLIFWHDE